MKSYSITTITLLYFIITAALLPLTTAVANDDLKMLSINPDRLQTFKENGNTLEFERDPFNWPPEQIARFRALNEEKAKVDPFANLKLTGIIWDKDRPLAIINEKLIGLNDKINGSTIIDITKETVVLKNINIYHTLQFRAITLELNPAKEDN